MAEQAVPGREAVAAVWRIESARITGTLARYTGDFALAEDLAQEALAEALVAWPRDGVPREPAAWLLTVGRRRAIDAFRRRSALDERYAVLSRELPEGGAVTGAAAPDPAGPDRDLLWDPDRIHDDVLALVFTACHPVLPREARVALTLRVVSGLTSDEIARAFLVPTATVQARITRAKRTLAAAQVPFEVPPPEERRARLGSVLSVLYLVFTEGSTASSGSEWIRQDLAREAVRLTPVLAALVHAGRVGRGLGPYGVQAAIAECHAVAPSVEETDWERIVLLYDVLGRLAPSPVVQLNRAVAVSVARGPAAALPLVDELAQAGSLAGSHLLPSVPGELLARLDRFDA